MVEPADVQARLARIVRRADECLEAVDRRARWGRRVRAAARRRANAVGLPTYAPSGIL